MVFMVYLRKIIRLVIIQEWIFKIYDLDDEGDTICLMNEM